ncbi:hypothetical protein BsWGS_25496 [Bradybaena similaris]
MNHAVLVSLVLVALWAGGAAGDCDMDICERVDCRVILESECKDVFIPKGGYCGCCDACYKAIDPGQPCQPLAISNPQTAVCKKGYYCSYGICRPLVG